MACFLSPRWFWSVSYRKKKRQKSSTCYGKWTRLAPGVIIGLGTDRNRRLSRCQPFKTVHAVFNALACFGAIKRRWSTTQNSLIFRFQWLLKSILGEIDHLLRIATALKFKDASGELMAGYLILKLRAGRILKGDRTGRQICTPRSFLQSLRLH